ncbi:hypothetical protein phytr_10550 [Candidatus Phycorickettsia trachydisci]|uniref:GTA TIM-barrel-like domain-containing protein n=1 Tax=Candidatus Phycorickettsia trachydisci TaxID=2115978 RepID=A0A2P1P9N3_9RICK|nr:glycoside hydrolase TIM-barrel-like domain-containing protein [Candidatus Phycorickettsia trachydisci]AVP87983.1 hypothetical protein phytr_10550 [Candidatus Phycorickettsia trachydisci]
MKVCFDDLLQESAGLLALDNYFDAENPLSLDLYAFEGASINIQVKGAESQEIHIPKLQITTYNFNILYFVPNRYKVFVDQLEIKCPGIHLVADGLNIGQCHIDTTRPQVWIENFQAESLTARCMLDEDEEQVRKLLPGITVIPGCGEYVLDEAFDSLDRLKQDLPNVEWISPVVAWFASSLDLKTCKIIPGIDTNLLENPKHPKIDSWQVGEYTSSCNFPMKINQVDERSIYGGTINDASVIEYLKHAQELGFKIIFYPLIMVNQIGKPWRGWIGKDEQVTVEDVQNFYENQYRPFILHYAELVAGRVDAFIIGSELIGLTSLKTEDNLFPFVKKLIELAGLVREILGPDVKISYAADWSEYHSVGGYFRPLDELWANQNIDFVGIDAYFPLTHSQESRFSLEEIGKGFTNGEGCEFYFDGDRKIEFKKSEPWNQWKNLHDWWHNEHWIGNDKTLWQPKMKPIWFTEFGFPSIDKAPNKPNVFYNPECRDGGVPTFSNGKTDYAVQRLALRAALEYWQEFEFMQNMICWTWDARGENWMNCSYYADGPLWKCGHWIDGKIGAPRNEVALKGNNIDIKNLVVAAPKVKFDQINIIIRDVAALSGDSLTISDS